MPGMIDLATKRFGRLVAVRPDGKIGDHIAWLCQCDCGKTKRVASCHLQGKKICSCGCITRQLNKTRAIRHGLCGTVRYMMWKSALNRSKAKKLPFNITVLDVPEAPAFCPILGIPLVSNTGHRGTKPNSPTLDRIKPVLGYVIGNIQVISSRANTIKNDASAEE